MPWLSLEAGEFAVPEDGPVAWTTHADLAEGAVTALVDGGLDAPTPALTASQSVDMAGVAAIASALTGRPVERVVVSATMQSSEMSVMCRSFSS